MDYLLEALSTAFALIAERDPAVTSAVTVSVQLSLTSSVLSAVVALPVGYAIGTASFRGKRVVSTFFHGMMSVPTVAIGLIVYAVLSRRGALGDLGWLYTKQAIVCGQVLLAFPLMTALSLSATQSLDSRVAETLRGLGATSTQTMVAVFREARYAYLAAVVSGFGRVISEVGISMMAGGNIRGSTRTITTAIALETSKGEFAVGIALGLILVTLAFAVTGTLNLLQRPAAAHA